LSTKLAGANFVEVSGGRKCAPFRAKRKRLRFNVCIFTISWAKPLKLIAVCDAGQHEKTSE